MPLARSSPVQLGSLSATRSTYRSSCDPGAEGSLYSVELHWRWSLTLLRTSSGPLLDRADLRSDDQTQPTPRCRGSSTKRRERLSEGPETVPERAPSATNRLCACVATHALLIKTQSGIGWRYQIGSGQKPPGGSLRMSRRHQPPHWGSSNAPSGNMSRSPAQKEWQ
jgi:hypothetical protein